MQTAGPVLAGQGNEVEGRYAEMRHPIDTRALAGAVTGSGHMEHSETLYEHAGGDEALHRLEELFYDKVLAHPVLKTQFRERIPTHVGHLTWFTAESTSTAT